MSWKEEFEKKLNSGEIQTDSDIEDFVEKEYTKEYGIFFSWAVWDYYYELKVKGTPCEGCKYACKRFYADYYSPCTNCLRRKLELKDKYEKKEIENVN